MSALLYFFYVSCGVRWIVAAELSFLLNSYVLYSRILKHGILAIM